MNTRTWVWSRPSSSQYKTYAEYAQFLHSRAILLPTHLSSSLQHLPR